MSGSGAEGTEKRLGASVASAAKWSIVTQLVAKLISPVTTLILAHLLTPEAFGVVATVTMVTSFAEMFSDAGFQKYLVQHEFKDDGGRLLATDVAFWTNLGVACALWALIFLFRDPVASLVGNPGLGGVISVACASLPLVSLSSVQTATYQRALDFKTLFSSRVGSALVVLFVSVPLAFAGCGYWSMVAGTLASNAFLAVWLTARSSWKPRPRYSASALRAMLSFSVWTLLEQFAIWLTSWAGTFVLGSVMSAGYLGMYKTSTSLVSSITGIATSAVNPVIFSGLSRLQGDRERFNAALYSVQRYLALVLVPLAGCLVVFRERLVGILLGPQWGETALFFGLYAAASSVVVVFCHTASEAYRALGMPRVSMLAQVLYLALLVPTMFLSAGEGYQAFSVAVPLVRAVGFTAVHMVLCKFLAGLSPLRMLRGQSWVYVLTIVDCALCALLVSLCDSYWVQVPILLLGVAVYVVLVVAVPATRATAAEMLGRFGAGGLAQRLSRVVKRGDRKSLQ